MAKTDLSTKLDDYHKPFAQEEAAYVMTAKELETRCETCRFFKYKNLYDPCHMLPNDAPLPIVGGGVCNLYVLMVPGTSMDHMSELNAAMSQIPEAFNPSEPSGFKVIKSKEKDYWLGWYSNNFEDLEGDIFSEDGLDFQNRMVSLKMWDAPDLWCMHQEYLKHGKALITFRIGHFQFALGEFDDVKTNPLVKPFIKYYEENPVTMSHGFFFDPDKYTDGIFHRWRTFEVSTIKPGREANPLTQFSLSEVDKMLKGKDREFVEKIIGVDKLKEIETSAEARGKVLVDAGLSYKAAPPEEDDEEEEDEKGDPKDPKKKPPKKAGIDEVLMIEVLQKMHASMMDALEAATKIANISAAAVVQSDDRLGAVETKLSRLAQQITEVLEPGSASKSKNTIVPEGNEAADSLIEKNHAGDKGSRKSLLEELAIQVGDDPSIYTRK